jgi:hypothetical protein
MRTLVTVTVPAATGSRAIKDGSMGKIIGTFQEKWKPEASYFYTVGGDRTAMFVVDIKEASQMPSMFEPLFAQLDARIDLKPVLNTTDLQSGLAALAKA